MRRHDRNPRPHANFPPETLTHILSYVSLEYPTLLATSLVSHVWHDCTAPVLYGDLAGTWDSRMTRLIRTFDANPS